MLFDMWMAKEIIEGPYHLQEDSQVETVRTSTKREYIYIHKNFFPNQTIDACNALPY